MTNHELMMPFVNVKSNGGPHDDEAYTCGYEMGTFDARCERSKNLSINLFKELIHSSNTAQADLIAMSYGYIIADHIITGEWNEITLQKGEGQDAQ